jgi:hypothetical protein
MAKMMAMTAIVMGVFVVCWGSEGLAVAVAL